MKQRTRILSMLLAVLMLVTAVPAFTIGASAALETITYPEPTVPTLGKATIVDYGWTSPKGARSANPLSNAFDGDPSTVFLSNGEPAQTYSIDYSGESGTQPYDIKTNTNKARKYRGTLNITLDGISTLNSVTIWGGSNKTEKLFANNEFDILYSIDGTYWYLTSAYTYASVCGNAAEGASGGTAGAGSAAFTLEKVVNDTTYYGLQADFGGVRAKYIKSAW